MIATNVGLGLCISKLIVGKYGGTISFDSRKGGSRFHFDFAMESLSEQVKSKPLIEESKEFYSTNTYNTSQKNNQMLSFCE